MYLVSGQPRTFLEMTIPPILRLFKDHHSSLFPDRFLREDEGAVLNGLPPTSWAALLYHVLRIVGEERKPEVLNTLSILCRDCTLPRVCSDYNQYHHLRLQIATQLAASDHSQSQLVIDAMRWFLRGSFCKTLLPIKLLAGSLPCAAEARMAFVGQRFVRRCFVQSKVHTHSLVYHALFAGQSLLDERYASAFVTSTRALDNFRKLAGIVEGDAESHARMQFALHACMAVAAGKRSCSRKCTDSRRALLHSHSPLPATVDQGLVHSTGGEVVDGGRVAYLLERFSDAVRLVHRCIRLLPAQDSRPQVIQPCHNISKMKQSILPCTDACRRPQPRQFTVMRQICWKRHQCTFMREHNRSIIHAVQS